MKPIQTALLSSLLVFFSCLAAPAADKKTAANVPLVNQEGKPFQLYDLKGEYLFLSFIYTRCPFPKMCPLTVSLNRELFEQWKTTKPKRPLHFLIITLDPRHDSPAVLKAFAKSRHLDLKYFTLATGTPQTLSSIYNQFSVAVVPEGEYVGHNNRNVLLDPKMVVVKNYEENQWTPEQVLKSMDGQ